MSRGGGWQAPPRSPTTARRQGPTEPLEVLCSTLKGNVQPLNPFCRGCRTRAAGSKICVEVFGNSYRRHTQMHMLVTVFAHSGQRPPSAEVCQRLLPTEAGTLLGTNVPVFHAVYMTWMTALHPQALVRLLRSVELLVGQSIPFQLCRIFCLSQYHWPKDARSTKTAIHDGKTLHRLGSTRN